jgi:hypothetical protein
MRDPADAPSGIICTMRTIIDPDRILRELTRLRATAGEPLGSLASTRMGTGDHHPLDAALNTGEGQETRRPRQ